MYNSLISFVVMSVCLTVTCWGEVDVPDITVVEHLEYVGTEGAAWINAVTVVLETLGLFWTSIVSLALCVGGWYYKVRKDWKIKDFQNLAEHKGAALVEVSEKYADVRMFAKNMIGAIENMKDIRPAVASDLVTDIRLQSEKDNTESCAKPLVTEVKQDRAGSEYLSE